MNKNTMFYGLIALGGVLAYYAWKQHSLSMKQSSENATTPLSHTSGIFADDVPVSQELADVLQGTGGIKPVRTIKETVSQIIEPLIGTPKQTVLTGQGQFLES
jgi:hypothetical protein